MAGNVIEEGKEEVYVSKSKLNKETSQGNVGLKSEQGRVSSGGPWTQRSVGKERGHRLTDGGGECPVRPIGARSEEDIPGNSSGDFMVKKTAEQRLPRRWCKNLEFHRMTEHLI